MARRAGGAQLAPKVRAALDHDAEPTPAEAVGGAMRREEVHGRAALTWFDERDGNEEVYLSVSPQTELVDGVERSARRITHTPGESIGAYLAWNGDVGGLAWCDNSLGQHEVYFVRFDVRGAPVGAAERLTDNPSDSLIPAIRPWRNGFALVWNEFVPGRGGDHGTDGRSEVWFSFVSASGK